jgi:hypothetical protein
VTHASRRPRTAWAFALVVAVVALAGHAASQIGKSGCVRHGVAASSAEHAGAPELAAVVDGDTAHGACALCAAPTATGASVGTVAVAAPAPIELRASARLAPDRSLADAPPLDYAPKTSPPAA